MKFLIGKLLCLSLLMMQLAALRCHAEDSDLLYDQPQPRVSTPTYHADFSQFRPVFGTYDYVVSWQGIPAARASVTLTQEGMRYRMVAEARTYSGIDLFYKLRYRGESLMSAVDLQPIRSVIDQQENSTKRNTQLEFLDSGEIRAIRTKNGHDAVITTTNTDNFTLEPFSAAFLARTFAWTKGQTRELDTFNGKTRYLVSLTAVDEETIRVNGEPRSVWVIVPRVRIADEDSPHKKLRDAKIYITADSRRDILKIVSSVFIGSVSTALDAFTPLQSGSGLTHMASRERILLK